MNKKELEILVDLQEQYIQDLEELVDWSMFDDVEIIPFTDEQANNPANHITWTDTHINSVDVQSALDELAASTDTDRTLNNWVTFMLITVFTILAAYTAYKVGMILAIG